MRCRSTIRGTPFSWLGVKAFDGVAQWVDKDFRRLVGGGQVGDMGDGIGQQQMRVKDAPAVAAQPATVVLLNDLVVPGHRSMGAPRCRPEVVSKVPCDVQTVTLGDRHEVVAEAGARDGDADSVRVNSTNGHASKNLLLSVSLGWLVPRVRGRFEWPTLCGIVRDEMPEGDVTKLRVPGISPGRIRPSGWTKLIFVKQPHFGPGWAHASRVAARGP